MDEKVRAAAEMLSGARNVVALTGAGISKESGIPTFRDAQTGLWAKYNPQELATPSAFRRDPGLVWRWYDMRRQALGNVQPNPGHHALVALEKQLSELLIVTQNVDGLHAQAGSQKVIELHGNITRTKCFDRDHPAVNVALGLDQPPSCTICGSLLRPDVVWFEEALPQIELSRALDACQSCDVMLIIGTSGLVQPAASLPLSAKRAGSKLIEINPTETPISAIADLYLPGPSGEILPLIVSALPIR